MANHVEFHYLPIVNEEKSRLAGHHVYEDKEFVRIMSPGDKTSIPDKEVTDEHRREYAQQYAAFKAGQEQAVEGLPLREWPAVTRGQAETLAVMGVRTVEQLAEVSDGNLQALGAGTVTLKQKARDYMERAKGAAPIAQMRAEMEQAKAETELLKRQMAAILEERASQKQQPSNKK